MKFLVIIIILILIYFIIKPKRHSKEKTNDADNMILCKKCGFHVLQHKIRNTKESICEECVKKQ